MEQTIHTELSPGTGAPVNHNFAPGIIFPEQNFVGAHAVTASQTGGAVTLTVQLALSGATIHNSAFTLTDAQFKGKAYIPFKAVNGQVSVDNLRPATSQPPGKPLTVSIALDSTGGKIGGAGLGA
ncbi:hypothetical protein [Puia dinghuensis]|uniref:Uncharacterized protein n=1 Tax=Puia dinghuensis TaxID=1792502 RepID=A0A8J2XWF3_9BACT|nr:hypothetical protein [Puia dinghuensis]GGB23360.1 hypothetical protein GCM10011511_54030 [Puia dinghuensis]